MSRPAARRRQRRRRRNLPAPPPPPPTPTGPSLGRIALGALVWLVGSVTYFLLFAVRETSARGWVDAARWVTGGRPGLMAFAGWLTTFAVFGLVWTLILLRKRIHRAWLYTLGAVAVAISPTAIALFPLDGYRIVHLITGPGGSAFVTGMRWASVAGIIPFLVVPFAMAKNVSPRVMAGAVVVFATVTLIGAALTA